VKAPRVLKGEGSENRSLSLPQNMANIITVTTQLVKKFEGGPSLIKKVAITNVSYPLNITCSDENNLHLWQISPPMNTTGLKYFLLPISLQHSTVNAMGI